MDRRSWSTTMFAAALLAWAGAAPLGATTVPLGSASGGVAVYFNGTGPATLANGAYLRLQAAATNPNGAQFNFDSTPLPGTGGLLSWYGLFQSVPDQFGLDLVAKLASADGSVLPPVLDAYDNVNGSLAGRANAGPVTWAISGYTGVSDGPANPADAAINSLFRGGTGAAVIPTVPDGVTVTALSVTPSGSTQTLTFTAELTSDALVHWYNPATPDTPDTPVGTFDLTGRVIVSGTLAAPLPGGPGMTFFAGTISADAEVVCGPRYVATGGSDTIPGPAPNLCFTAGTPCATIQHAIDIGCPGDVVNVAGGVYAENVRVTKSITVDGAGTGTVVEPAVSNPNPCSGSSLCGGTASNVFLVQADGVTIENLAVDGDNPSLTSGIVVGGADLDARNGIIVDYTLGTFGGLVVHDVTVRNIYLRGIYASSGGTFDFHDDTIANVQADPSSIAMFNFGGSGTMANNVVSNANDAISSNHSAGVQFLDNRITASGSGVHTDNAGDGGGTADVIQGNQIGACQPNGYGIFVFVPYLAPTVQGNTVTGCAVGLAAFGTGNPVTTTFAGNAVNGTGVAGATGVLVTTDQIGFGSNNVSAAFSGNTIAHNAVGVDVEQQAGFTNAATFTCNRLSGNTTGVQSRSATAVAHQNVIEGGATGADGSGITSGMMNAENNWWGCSGGPGSFGCGAVIGSIDFTPFATAPDTCVPATRALNPTKVKVQRSTRPTAPNGSITLVGDFLADLPAGDVFDASLGIGVRVLDALGLDTNALAPPIPGWTAAQCTSATASGVVTRIKCQTPDHRFRGTFRAVNPINPGAPQGYRFSIKLKALALGAPFAGPVTVTITDGTGIERTGVISQCKLSASGLFCRSV